MHCQISSQNYLFIISQYFIDEINKQIDTTQISIVENTEFKKNLKKTEFWKNLKSIIGLKQIRSYANKNYFNCKPIKSIILKKKSKIKKAKLVF